MKVGVLKEIKNNENRVALTPKGVEALVEKGHSVLVEENAGAGSGLSDKEYLEAGAHIMDSPRKVCDEAQLIMKVKEPIEPEFSYFRENHLVFTYFHFASGEQLTKKMLSTKSACIAYETVEKADGSLPLLSPMSEVAGKMAPLMGAYFLAKFNSGRGILASSVTGTKPAKITVLGAGVSGTAAATAAHGLGAEVVVLQRKGTTFDHFKAKHPYIPLVESTPENIEEHVKTADVLVGAVLVAGAKAPKLVSRKLVSKMRPGTVIVDISIDQGGCIETSRPTSHAEPTFVEEGVIHYCVTNMPGAFPRTSTFALTAQTLPYAMEIADGGVKSFGNPEIYKGVNMYKGHATNKGVAEAFGLKYTELKSLL